MGECWEDYITVQYMCTYTNTAETAVKARREIADYMKAGRIERARIRVSNAVSVCAVSVLLCMQCQFQSCDGHMMTTWPPIRTPCMDIVLIPFLTHSLVISV